MHDRPPILVDCRGPASATALLWNHAGRYTLTVVVGVTVSLREGVAALLTPTGLCMREEPGRHDSDLAPHKPRADITFVGSAVSTNPASQLMTRLCVRGRWGELERRILVVGDRVAPAAPPAPFRELPVVWESAWASDDNPVGVPRGGGRLPNLVDPENEFEAASYGQIPRSWANRARFLGQGGAAQLEGLNQQMPAQISWGYFLAAPPQQQVPRLFGDESIELDHLVPGRAALRSRLEISKPQVRYFGTGAPAAGAVLETKCDTLRIDGASARADLVFRGTMACLDPAHLAQGRIVIEMAGKPLPEAEPSTTRAALPDSHTIPIGRPLISVPNLYQDPPTYDLDDDDAAPSVGSSTMALDPEAAMLLLSGVKATPWEQPPPPPAPPPPAPPPAVPVGAFPPPSNVIVSPVGQYVPPEDDYDSIGSTMALSPEAAAALLVRPPVPVPVPVPMTMPAQPERAPRRQGTLEMESNDDLDSVPPATMILQTPDEPGRR